MKSAPAGWALQKPGVDMPPVPAQARKRGRRTPATGPVPSVGRRTPPRSPSGGREGAADRESLRPCNVHRSLADRDSHSHGWSTAPR